MIAASNHLGSIGMLIAVCNQKSTKTIAASNHLGSIGMLIAVCNQKRPNLIAHSNRNRFERKTDGISREQEPSRETNRRKISQT
jgi:hypothetical protein